MLQEKDISSIEPDKNKEEPEEKNGSTSSTGSETEVKNANAAGLGAIGRNDQKISPEESKGDQNKTNEQPPY